MKNKKKQFAFTIPLLLLGIVFVCASLFHFLSPIFYYAALDSHTTGIARTVGAVSSVMKNSDDMTITPFDYENPQPFDVKHYDLSGATITLDEQLLEHVSFDTETIWPDNLPSSFSPPSILENAKNPGLGIRTLHQFGIDGSGVSIAIIGPALYTEHLEFSQNLVHYEEYHMLQPDSVATEKATALASLAVGETVGVAPNAKLYYFAVDAVDSFGKHDGAIYAKVLHRILELNDTLPQNEKIRAIALPDNTTGKGQKKLEKAMQDAYNKSIYVASMNRTRLHTFHFAGTGHSANADPDDSSVYTVATAYQPRAANKDDHLINAIFLPLDTRTVAAPSGQSDYIYNSIGTPDNGVAYLIGLYALTVQVNPDITPSIFSSTIYNTAGTLVVDNYGISYTINHLVNPLDLIATVAK